MDDRTSPAPTVVGSHGRYRICYAPDWGLGSVPQHVFTCRDGAPIVATLIVNGAESDWRGGLELPPWTIFNVSVRASHQRQGIATALLAQARRMLPAVWHSPYRNTDGEAWARSDPTFADQSR